MENLYRASVTVTGGRNGHAKSSDGTFETDLRKPRELGGQGGAPNPEQLFAAAWGACYIGALQSIAEREGVTVDDASVEVHVSFNKDGNAFTLSADLDVRIPSISLEEAQKIATKAHHACPYSRATKNNINTRVTAV